METLRYWVTLTLVFTLVMTSIHGQSAYDEEDPPSSEENTYSSAYMQSYQTAHWSAYVPIGIMVAAAIWFGIADRKHDDASSDSRYSRRSRYKGYRHSTGTYSHH